MSPGSGQVGKGQAPALFQSFAVGLCVGSAAAAKWRPLVKVGVKAGIKGTARLTRTALRCAEDLVDVIQEARCELAEEGLVDVDAGGREVSDEPAPSRRIVPLVSARYGPPRGLARAAARVVPSRLTS